MKRIFLFILLFVCLSMSVTHSQLYYKVDKVLDVNFNYLSQSSSKYKQYVGQIVTLNMSPYSPDVYVKVGMLPQVGPYPFAGADGNGYNVYAFTDVYGNVMFTDFMGRLNYVAVASDLSEISYPVSYDNVVLECSQTTREEYEAMVWKHAEQRANIEAAIQGYGVGSGNVAPIEPAQGTQGGMSAEWYQAQYNKWASSAESIYNSLSAIRTTDRYGNKEGYSDWGGTSSEAQMKVQLSNAQREMRNIRNEAARYGYSIPMSTWETAVVR